VLGLVSRGGRQMDQVVSEFQPEGYTWSGYVRTSWEPQNHTGPMAD
jgi:hypothetical protein